MTPLGLPSELKLPIGLQVGDDFAELDIAIRLGLQGVPPLELPDVSRMMPVLHAPLLGDPIFRLPQKPSIFCVPRNVVLVVDDNGSGELVTTMTYVSKIKII